jgi:hypothetical protein
MEIKWRKYKVGEQHCYELWEFRCCNKYFSCICYSIYKKRSPRRIFLEFAKYIPFMNFKFIENGSSFLVEERFIYRKIE